jgi:DNA-binding FadR family transcriptional regulator
MEACHNPLITQINVTLQQFLSLSLEITAHLPNKAAESLPTHRAVVDAVRARDEARSYQAMKKALDLSLDVLLDELVKEQDSTEES